VELILRKGADSLLVNHQLFGAGDGAMKFGGGGAFLRRDWLALSA
jgi:type III secretory pathway component EscV